MTNDKRADVPDQAAQAPQAEAGCGSGCGCARPGKMAISRRDLLRWSGAGAFSLGMSGHMAMAGPFQVDDFQGLVPEDKKLSDAWIKSLFERGEPTVYTGRDLDWIGMPIGGLCAGQLYLGGDGRLWHWDVFNQHIATGAAHYAEPIPPSSPLDQGFAIRVDRTVHTLDRNGFADIRFRGQYPIAEVEYRDAQLPVQVQLEAFSPFIPLDVDDSSLPATVMRFTVRNVSDRRVDIELVGWLENAVCLNTGKPGLGVRFNQITRTADSLMLECRAAEPEKTQREDQRPDILFENWQRDTYAPWSVSGTAFGSGPVRREEIPSYQGDVGGPHERVVNSHASAPGTSIEEKDGQTGTLTSAEFTIERDYIRFWIGGGNHAGKTCLNLVVDGRVALSAAGHANNRMRLDEFDVRHLQGKRARLRIVDDVSGPWGNIGVGEIVLSDRPAAAAGALEDRPDYGTMALTLLEPQPTDRGAAMLPADTVPAGLFAHVADNASGSQPFGTPLRGGLSRVVTLAAGQEATATFVLSWHFPHDRIDGVRDSGRQYATRYRNAVEVSRYVIQQFARLHQQTRLWRDTWYDSTLPCWFLDRTFLNASILASSTCHWFSSGRFYGWEGVGCCAGTCTHVWQYAQAVARLFPALERDLRERTDLGLAFDPATGIIRFRGESAGLAVDGQAGCVLRSYREHLMSADGQFLERNWGNIKRAVQCLIDKDADANGILESAQHNTLDADWYGPVAWLSGLYLAALHAAEQMAEEMRDAQFAGQCRQIAERGRRYLTEQLFDGEYFINQPDPNRPDTINSGTGCHIDQVLGQSWAWQVGLGRVLPEHETRSALRSLWRYNFTPDVGPYREVHQPGRWYAMPGEAGLLMCTFPRSDWGYEQAAGKGPNWAAGYFNECMNGFEYQVAGHMIWEGMLLEGMAITRAVHDRYHASRRNPWNEVECGDHYARSMASYGVFLAACGFEYHGPRGFISFAPRLNPEDFRAPFTTAQGWGTFQQQRTEESLHAHLDLRWGTLRMREFALSPTRPPTQVVVSCNNRELTATIRQENGRAIVVLAEDIHLAVGDQLTVTLR